jgi:DNA polymerase delta subunit 1
MEILGRGKHDVKPHEMFEIYRSRNIDDVTRVARYCIQDAMLVVDLYDKLSIWYGLVELSNVVGVLIKDLYVYGQQIRCLSQIYDLCAKNSIVIDKPSSKSDTITNYKGGFVFEPKVGLHEHIICLDFKSLYPSIIQAFNICYSTLVINNDIKDDDCNIIEWYEGDIHHRYRFIKSNIRKGILPILVEKLVDERNQVRKKMESTKDPLIRNIFDKRQLALKISANAIYGFLGVSEGILSLLECAMSVTAKGRDMIQTCQRYLESKYNANVVYGDTDSIMFSINGVDYTNINEWGKRMQAEITSLFPRPLSTEFEKAGMILCLRKKHYAFWPVGFKPGSVIYRGITLARRDKFPYHKKIYGKVIDMILTKRPIYDTYDYIIESIKNLLTRQVPISDLVIVKEVGKSYKSDRYSIKVFEEKMARQGVIINAGDRIEYVITVGEGLLGERMVLVDRYQGEPIDYYYYITNLLMKSIDNLFYVGYRSVIDDMLSKHTTNDYNTFLRYVLHYTNIDNKEYIKAVIDNNGGGKTISMIRSLWRYVMKSRVMIRITDKPIYNFSRYIDLRMKCMQELKCRWNHYWKNWLSQPSMNPLNLLIT